MGEAWVAEEMQILLGKPSKLEHGKNWEKFPTGGRGGSKKIHNQVSLWKFFGIGVGGGKNFHKVPKFIKKKGVKRA